MLRNGIDSDCVSIEHINMTDCGRMTLKEEYVVSI